MNSPQERFPERGKLSFYKLSARPRVTRDIVVARPFSREHSDRSSRERNLYENYGNGISNDAYR